MKQRLWAWFLIIFGAVGAWSCLVELVTHDNPIFGDLSSHEPKWVAAEAIVALGFLITGALWIDKAGKDEDS